jgi:beta-galactosidase
MPNDATFCLNGIVWPNRTPHPAVAEVKYLYQPLAITAEAGAVKVSRTALRQEVNGSLKF